MADFISGKHLVSRLYVSSNPWEVKVKSTTITEDAVEVADDVNGENRSRLQKITNFYSVTMECFDDGTSSAILRTWLANQQNEDNNAPQLPLAGGLKFKYLDGTSAAFVLQGCTLGPLNYNASGRKERNMATVKYRCQYFNPTASA